MKSRLLLLVSFVVLTSCSDDSTRGKEAPPATLTLLREKTFRELLAPDGRYEASGVALQNGSLRVVFDNSTQLAEIDVALSSALLGPGTESSSQYEGITIATRPAARTFVVKEADADGRDAIVTLDERGSLVATEPTDVVGGQKGYEGIAWLDDIERMLVLCEANACGEGDDRPGHGVIKSLRHEPGRWVTDANLSLPEAAAFADYSDLAVLPEGDGVYRIAVLSQESASLWLGGLTTRPLAFTGRGAVYTAPTDAGQRRYCALEGATFVTRTTLALVSDRSKGDAECDKTEAVHVFALP